MVSHCFSTLKWDLKARIRIVSVIKAYCTIQIFFRFFTFLHDLIVLTLVAKKMGFCVFAFSHHSATKVSNEK